MERADALNTANMPKYEAAKAREPDSLGAALAAERSGSDSHGKH
jgi:hypothetical protein